MNTFVVVENYEENTWRFYIDDEPLSDWEQVYTVFADDINEYMQLQKGIA